MKAHRGLRFVLALMSAAVYGYATWLKVASSHESAGAWLIGVPVALILISRLTYLHLRYLSVRKGRQSSRREPDPD